MRPVVPAVVGGWSEILADVIGREQRGAARLAVQVRRLDGALQVLLRRHVDDRIVNEHGVEPAAEPDGPHVAFDMLAFRIELAAHLEHARRHVDQCHGEPPLRCEALFPPPLPSSRMRAARSCTPGQQRLLVERGFFGVVLGRRQ